VARRTLGRLLELGNRVGQGLRASPDPRVRRAAALALVGTLALFSTACDEISGVFEDPGADSLDVVAAEALATEVSQGMPTTLDQKYEVSPESIARDDRGVYYFQWKDPATGEFRDAAASRIQVASSDSARAELSVPSGGDPVLALGADTAVHLIWPRAESEGDSADGSIAVGTPTAVAEAGGTGGYYLHNHWYPSYFLWGYHFVRWYPLHTGGAYTRSPAAYRDPPTGASLVAGQRLDGSLSSTTPKPFADRTISRVAVSGMNRGTGVGYAVTGKTATSSVSRSAFASGRSGVTVGPATGKSSGVRAPSSGGFSAGRGGGSSGSAS
jgi:hypothetical protein